MIFDGYAAWRFHAWSIQHNMKAITISESPVLVVQCASTNIGELHRVVAEIARFLTTDTDSLESLIFHFLFVEELIDFPTAPAVAGPKRDDLVVARYGRMTFHACSWA